MYLKIDTPPPKERRFLVRNKCFHFNGRTRRFDHEGYKWEEAWWDGKQFRLWCGNTKTWTTDSLDYDEWADLPKNSP